MDKNVLEINNKKLCAFCFSDLTTADHCSDCAKNNGTDLVDALPMGTILHGRFIVGKAVYYDNSYYCYYGYDPESNERVLVRELFPAGGFCKRVNKGLVCDLKDSAMVMELKTAVNNFHTEAKIMSGIKDITAVTTVFDLFDENGTTYSVVAFPQKAVLLSEYIKNIGGKLEPKEAFRIFDGIIRSLDVIHKNGTIHGNIRPENVVLIDKKVILTGMNYGGNSYIENRSSPVYTELNRFASLEQLSKSDKRGTWTDIFALGSTLYYMLTGNYVKNIFSRIDLLEDGRSPSAFDNSADLPNKLIPILEKMLQVKIDDRYRNLSDLTKDLTSAHLTKTKIKPVSDKQKVARKGGVIAVIIILVLVLCAAASVGFILLKNKDNDLPPDENIEENVSESTEDETGNVPDEIPSEEITDESETLPESDLPDSSAPDEENKTENSGVLDILNSITWQSNMMMATDGTETVFGNGQYSKSQITSAVFLSESSEIPENAWDISADKDSSVMAWVEQTDDLFELFIYANGGINAEISCKDLFADYVNLVSVDFNDCFHTENAVDMSGMFKNCASLTTVDLIGFNTDKVTDMSGMFEGCEQLISVDLSSFETKEVTNMDRMFCSCKSIESLDLSKFNTSKITSLESMFYDCASLAELKILHFIVPSSTNVTDMFFGCISLESIDSENEVIKTAFDGRSSDSN